jgi:nucleotide-binding universal stress UspA family protein
MRPLRTIAVGFDGSDDSKAAVRWAFDLANQVGADVVLVHAVGLLQRAMVENVTAELHETVRQVSNESGFDHARVRLHVANGDACSVLLRAKDAPLEADLLVVGSRGQGEHAGLLLGSTSLELAEHSTIPVVVVPCEREAS